MEKLFRNPQFLETGFACIILFFILSVAGCNEPVLSNAEQIRGFEIAGGDQAEGKIRTGPYRVVPGDVLEFQMPAILRASDLSSFETFRNIEPYLCRVSNSGTIPIPIIGEIDVAGKTLAEIEEAVADAYFPEYVVSKPAVVCKIEEHVKERSFTVTGLVMKPGVFQYPLNVQYSLMDAIAFAGGANMIADPHYVKIHRRNSDGEVVSATFKIDNKSFADAANVLIKPGDNVSVEVTPRTRTNMFLSSIFRVNVGAYVRPEDL